MTQFEKIKLSFFNNQMTAKRLAEFAVQNTKFFCSKKHGEVCDKPMSCTDCAESWLNSEVEEGD